MNPFSIFEQENFWLFDQWGKKALISNKLSIALIRKLISRFNAEGNLLKENQKIFNGMFLIIIKDVVERDINDLDNHFMEKIQYMIQKKRKKTALKYFTKEDSVPFLFQP